MSDIGINIPFPIVLALAGALFWPYTLGAALVLALLGLALPWRWVRIACFAGAAVLAADCLLAFWLGRD